MTKKDTKKHANAATWGAGKSGNPGGRSPRVGPNGETVAQLARQHTAEMVEVLVEVARDKLHPQRVAAANAILDRGWGKPKESVGLDARVEGSGVPVIQIVRVDGDSPG